MIRPLRQRHRHMVVVISVFLPVAFIVGIAARKPVSELNSLPRELAPAVAQFGAQEWQRADLFVKSPVKVRLLHEHNGAGKFAIEVSAADNFVKPDLIVYWIAGDQAVNDTLPDNAILLGSFGSMPLALPDEVVKSNGRLVLLSLADNEIVDASKPIRFGDPAN